ncbi:MAG: efflux RND transporter periplasmic adaptor subunit, partial [Planctomycetota bacterium]|nr:efflux RND transporter periplasmic adaptor subunit [Planctomycetota bacterium]
QHVWKQKTSESVAELIAALEERRPMKTLEEEFKDRMLGEFRGLLLSAYSKFILADKLASKVNSAAETGAVSSRLVNERTSERESAEETLKSVCEQSLFDTQRGKEAAQAAVQDAQRRYDISRHHLTSLLGYEEPGMERGGEAAGLSLVEMRAPFAGTIEERVFGVAERLKRGDRQFALANTSQLWIAADLREADWPALALQTGQELPVETPALPGVKLKARVYYLGREVSTDSNAIPLVATIDNSDERLRPGLFVRVSIPLEADEEVLAVPSSAVVEHERQRFVFVPEAGNHFRRVDVKTGREEAQWIEIRSGLNRRQSVVVAGAFALKSELLLEREE